MQRPHFLRYFLCYKLCNNPQPVQDIYINRLICVVCGHYMSALL